MNSAKFYFSLIYTSVLFILSIYLFNSRESALKTRPVKTSPKVDYILNYDYGENVNSDDEVDDSVAEDGIRIGKDGFSIQDSSCTPPGGMVFLKKHKSASSTLQTVAKNFCRYYSMPSESPPVGSVSGGYPGPFQPQFLGAPRHPKPLAISTHQVFNYEIEKSLFPENSFFLTSVREPFSLFRSMFEYFYRRWDSEAAVRNRKCGFTCWGAPYAHWLAEDPSESRVRFGAEISEYLDRLPKIFNKSDSWAFRAKNFQAFELGLDWTRDDKKYVNSKINELNQAFDLILLAEYFYESLVLLREKLCLPWTAMYARSRMVSKPYTKEPFTSSQTTTLKKFYAQDFQIYKYFNQTLQKKISAYGRARMSHDARKLRQMYALCDRQPKRCSFSRPQGRTHKSDPVDNSVVNASALIEYMEAHQGSCEWGAFAKLKNNQPTGCGQDEVLFPKI